MDISHQSVSRRSWQLPRPKGQVFCQEVRAPAPLPVCLACRVVDRNGCPGLRFYGARRNQKHFFINLLFMEKRERERGSQRPYRKAGTSKKEQQHVNSHRGALAFIGQGGVAMYEYATTAPGADAGCACSTAPAWFCTSFVTVCMPTCFCP